MAVRQNGLSYHLLYANKTRDLSIKSTLYVAAGISALIKDSSTLAWSMHMTGKEPRFSRKFLTILMVITAITIALLSRTGASPDSETDISEQQAPPTLQN